MIRYTNAILFSLIFISLNCQPRALAQEPEQLVAAKMLYSDSLKKLENDHQEKVLDLMALYAELLDVVKGHFQSMGNLDAVLRVDAEQQAARSGRDLPPLMVSDPPELSMRRGQYDRGLASLNLDFEQKVSSLRNVFLGHLKMMQSKFTRENRIDEAIAVQNEVKAMEAEASLPGEANLLVQVTAQNRFRLVWGMPQRAKQALVLTEGLQRKPNLLMDADTKLEREGLNFKGGRVEIEGMEDELFQAVQSTGAWSLLVEFTPNKRRQGGPARIITYSNGSNERNFTLGQRLDRLVLRLRTSDNDLNGTNPELDLGELKPFTRTKVAFSYSDNGVICYRDGVAFPVENISGDFSNWEKMHLLLGNEWHENRPWLGVIHAFAISNGPLTSQEAEELSKL
jgi:hypothetical protein